MRLHSKHVNKATGIVYELTFVQSPQMAKGGQEQQWLILKNAAQKYPISVEMSAFERDYEPKEADK